MFEKVKQMPPKLSSDNLADLTATCRFFISADRV